VVGKASTICKRKTHETTIVHEPTSQTIMHNLSIKKMHSTCVLVDQQTHTLEVGHDETFVGILRNFMQMEFELLHDIFLQNVLKQQCQHGQIEPILRIHDMTHCP
jgi:hypothetical protein